MYWHLGGPYDAKPLNDVLAVQAAAYGVLPHLPDGWAIGGGNLHDVDRVFPLATIPHWLAARTFYELFIQSVRWLLLPLLALFVVHALVRGGETVDVIVELAYDVGALLLVFGLSLFVAGRATNRALRSSAARYRRPDELELIRSRLENGQPPPLGGDLTAEIGVFVSGHTHAPSLTGFDAATGFRGALVNSGCWLRQLQPVRAHLGAPPVFVSRFVQTHVRVYWDGGSMQVELWEHPRPSPQRMRVVERLAVAGRRLAEPEGAHPRVRARASV
jgi:hypothetical protein